MSCSLAHLVSTSLSKDTPICRGQETLFARLCVRDLRRKLLGWACHLGSLVGIELELLRRDSLLGESQLDVFQVFILVQPDLDAARSLANALHVVLVQIHIDNLLSS